VRLVLEPARGIKVATSPDPNMSKVAEPTVTASFFGHSARSREGLAELQTLLLAAGLQLLRVWNSSTGQTSRRGDEVFGGGVSSPMRAARRPKGCASAYKCANWITLNNRSITIQNQWRRCVRNHARLRSVLDFAEKYPQSLLIPGTIATTF
jgi:hypothetical protein